MNTQHTPGPWEAMDSVRYDNIVRCCVMKDGKSICDTARTYYGQDDNVAKANARIIAAAPELLEACRACLLRDDIASDELGDMLRAAIAKATTT